MPRHEFYRRNWRTVLPIWSAVFAFAGWLAWTRLPYALFQQGVMMLALVILYFVIVHLTPAAWRHAWPKEAAVAVLFSLGASLAAWNQIRSMEDVETILVFSCLCWINCVAIEQWEGNKTRGWPIDTAAIGVAAAALILLHQHRPVLSAAEAASALAFVFLDRGRHRFSADAMRVLADVALLSPILFLPLAGISA